MKRKERWRRTETDVKEREMVIDRETDTREIKMEKDRDR
jgi:hypothetical protein